jgi:hypothetical protein
LRLEPRSPSEGCEPALAASGSLWAAPCASALAAWLCLWLLVAPVVGCARATPVPSAHPAPLWEDPDRRLFRGPPAKYHSGKYTDIIDQVALRPLARALAVDPGAEAINLNTLDEVPDSSWFTNRMGRHAMTPEQVAIGPCTVPPLDMERVWTVVGAKSDGVTPGFVVRTEDGASYLLKFDRVEQGPRSTAADAIASRLYYAAGYGAPCNRVVFFERSQLAVGAAARGSDWLGDEHPYTVAELERSLASVPRTSDGRYRALASLWLTGKSLGPFRFEGTRADDPNDIVDHEDRRELRGLRLLAAWTGHGDAREQNTLDSWIEAGNGFGWVRHSLLDFGDCFGNLTAPTLLARRLAGHAYGVDAGQIAVDWLTFGAITRPFEAERFGASGPVFGYFNVERFDPELWRPSYPNPAFQRMTERDAAWMARILARFTPAHLERVIRVGRLGSAELRAELLRLLLGRRERILRRYLAPLSSLAAPVQMLDGGRAEWCVDDLGVVAGIADAAGTTYEAEWRGLGTEPVRLPVRVEEARVCLALPPPTRNASASERVVEWRAFRAEGPREGQLRLHLAWRSSSYEIAALERLP